MPRVSAASLSDFEAAGLNQADTALGSARALLQCAVSHPGLLILPETQERDQFSPLGRSGG